MPRVQAFLLTILFTLTIAYVTSLVKGRGYIDYYRKPDSIYIDIRVCCDLCERKPALYSVYWTPRGRDVQFKDHDDEFLYGWIRA